MLPRNSPPMPSDVRALQKLGESQYRMKNYRKAIETFSKAIDIGRGDALNLLDSRAATHCAIGSLTHGLRDGRQMIDTDKYDARGYLRTAKVLQLMKRFDDAIRLYKHALLVLDCNAPRRAQIEALLLKLETAMTPPKRIDPFVALPAELVSLILDHLDLRSTLKATCVCKRWRSLSNDLSKQWRCLDLRIARKRPSLSTIRAFIMKTNGGLKEAFLYRLKPDLVPNVLELLSRCNTLASLEIGLPNAVKGDILRLPQLRTLTLMKASTISTETFLCILSSCPHLERVTTWIYPGPWTYNTTPMFPNLNSLSLASVYLPNVTTTCISTWPLFRNGDINFILPNLEELRLFPIGLIDPVRMPDHPRLKLFQYSNARLAKLPDLPKTLEYLYVDQTIVYRGSQDDSFGLVTDLKSAEFSQFSGFTPTILKDILSNNKSLTQLSIRWCSEILFEDLDCLMREGLFESITHLDIAGITNVNDAIAPLILENMPKLEVLDLSHTKITGLTVKQFCDSETPKLRKLSTDHIGLDVVEYASSRDVQYVTRISSKECDVRWTHRSPNGSIVFV
ncbi:hypothetical protein LOZ65_002758 [Ophidiomyces ophidiicola]|nr:hypothetical protein LOZ65_002758 [Ophidiomyces ophidiicola]